MDNSEWSAKKRADSDDIVPIKEENGQPSTGSPVEGIDTAEQPGDVDDKAAFVDNPGNAEPSRIEEVDEEPSSVVFMDTCLQKEGMKVFGVSLLGRNHRAQDEPCQDFHLFQDLGDGWHLYVVSDGAGSAKASDRGSKTNCEVFAHLMSKSVEQLGWKDSAQLPSEKEWQMQFVAMARMLRLFIIEKVDMLDECIEPKDFNATLMALLVTPEGILCGHIGDGRMGYMDRNGVWKSIITPHRGEEVNQTIFVMNPWDKIRVPALKMSGVLVPETSVIDDVPQAVVVLTDGCENFSWNCLQMDAACGKYRDINTPFEPFWNHLLEILEGAHPENAKEIFINYIDSGTEACRTEDDDRTLLVGIYTQHKTDEPEDKDL